VSLDALEKIVSTCTSCHLHAERRNAVFSRGNPDAPFVVIGEAPGEHEDEDGRAFVGKSGRLLDQMLLYAGVPASQVYMTNVLKCRPPKNKFPKDDTPLTCLPYLKKQLTHIQPKAIVLAGVQALRYVMLLDTGQAHEPVTPWVGKQFRRRDLYGDARIGVIYHPAFLLRNDSEEDEELCVATISALWTYCQAKIAGDSPPLVPFVDLNPTPPPMFQRRSLFGEGQRYE